MAVRPILGFISSMLLIVLVAGPASGAAAQDVECNSELTAVVVGNVTVPNGGSCILRDATVTGNVSASAGSYFQAIRTRVAGDVVGTDAQTLFVDGGSTVSGSVRANRVAQVFLFSSRVRKNVRVDHATDQVFICGSTVERGSIRVARSARDIVIGDRRSNDCRGNSVRRGNMSVLRNTTDVQLVISGNRFPKGNLIVAGNTGTSQKIVQGNSGGKHIACLANVGQFRASQNRRWKSGGCNRS
jgi:hypothetical protein